MSFVALLSGGLDSAVAATIGVAARGRKSALALTFDYGQRAAAREVEAARAMASALGLEHRAIALPFLGEITRTALVDRAAEMPRPAPSDLDSPEAAARARAVWVPNRNGIFLAIAAAHAEAIGAASVVAGFNREEGATFPDNTPEFVALSNAALARSTLSKVTVETPVGALTKDEIVRRGREAGAPIPLVWSCYLGGAEHCGTCESCRRLFRALDAAGATGWFWEERRRALAAASERKAHGAP